MHILNYLRKFFSKLWIPPSESCTTFFCIPFPFAWSADAITCQSRTSNAFAYMEIFIIFKMFKSSCRRVAAHRPLAVHFHIYLKCAVDIIHFRWGLLLLALRYDSLYSHILCICFVFFLRTLASIRYIIFISFMLFLLMLYSIVMYIWMNTWMCCVPSSKPTDDDIFCVNIYKCVLALVRYVNSNISNL